MVVKFFGTKGGAPSTLGSDWGTQTPCVLVVDNEFVSASKPAIIFDMGTGATQCGEYLVEHQVKDIHIFISHYHLDHIMGLPIFLTMFNKHTTITIYGPGADDKDVESTFTNFLGNKYFPVGLSQFAAKIKFKSFKLEKNKICDIDIEYDKRLTTAKMCINAMSGNHPGDCAIYKLSHLEYSVKTEIVYMTDFEFPFNIVHSDNSSELENIREFVRGSNVLIAEAQYTALEYPPCRGYGHSTIDEMIRFNNECRIPCLMITHHDIRRSNDDFIKMAEYYESARDVKYLRLIFAKESSYSFGVE